MSAESVGAIIFERELPEMGIYVTRFEIRPWPWAVPPRAPLLKRIRFWIKQKQLELGFDYLPL